MQIYVHVSEDFIPTTEVDGEVSLAEPELGKAVSLISTSCLSLKVRSPGIWLRKILTSGKLVYFHLHNEYKLSPGQNFNS